MPRDDDYGQVDGEHSPFATSMRDQPWIQSSGQTPWHMWGNSQIITLELNPGPAQIGTFARNQLVNVNYKRPETWQWVFSAFPIRFDLAEPGQTLSIQLIWELTIGMGRTVLRNPAFDNFTWQWSGGSTPPTSVPTWTTETYGFNPRRAGTVPLVDPPLNKIDRIVAQDIYLNISATMTSDISPVVVAKRAQIEVGAMFSPQTHVRPEWLQLDVPPEAQFPGAEIGGR